MKLVAFVGKVGRKQVQWPSNGVLWDDWKIPRIIPLDLYLITWRKKSVHDQTKRVSKPRCASRDWECLLHLHVSERAVNVPFRKGRGRLLPVSGAFWNSSLSLVISVSRAP